MLPRELRMDEITSGGREQGALGSEQGSASDMQGEDDGRSTPSIVEMT